MKLLILLFTTFNLFLYHADGLAEYHYFMENDAILLKFEMDKNELEHYKINKECHNNKLFDICVTNYLLSQTNLKINDSNVTFDFTGSSVYNNHIILNFKSKTTYKSIHKIQVKNNSFYEVNSKFKNRVRIDLDRFKKSFLLTKNKNLITL